MWLLVGIFSTILSFVIFFSFANIEFTFKDKVKFGCLFLLFLMLVVFCVWIMFG